MRNSFIHFITALVFAGWIFPHVSIADDNALSIVQLAFRDHIVTISSAPEGLRYSVRTSSGEVLSENLSDQEFLAAHPQLHQRIGSGYANDDSESFVWAGRDEQLIEPPVDSAIERE
jgi:hypothetical protein